MLPVSEEAEAEEEEVGMAVLIELSERLARSSPIQELHCHSVCKQF